MFSSTSSTFSKWFNWEKEEPPAESDEPKESEDSSRSEPTENTPHGDEDDSKANEPAAAASAAGDSHQTATGADAAFRGVKDFGSFLYNFAKDGSVKVTEGALKTASLIKDTVEDKTFMGDFKQEQDKFVKSKNQKQCEVAVPPWVGYSQEELLKKEILSLSEDKRNFLRNPPAGVNFSFDFDRSFPVALALLAEDDKLKEMRFNLVPKQISEESFWKNYFYRVSLIKQSTQLTALAAETETEQKNSGANENQPEVNTNENISESAEKLEKAIREDDSPLEGQTGEFVSDAFNEATDIDHADSNFHEEMEQLRMESRKETAADSSDEMPEWEKELQQELENCDVPNEDEDTNKESEFWEEEINDMLVKEVEEQ